MATPTVEAVEAAAAAAKRAREAYNTALSTLRSTITTADRAGDGRNEIARAAREGLSRTKVLEHLGFLDIQAAAEKALGELTSHATDPDAARLRLFEKPAGVLNIELAPAPAAELNTLAAQVIAALHQSGLQPLGEGPDPARDLADGQSTRIGKIETRRGTESLGPVQLARYLGLKDWQVARAQHRGLLPGPDLPDGRFSTSLARSLADRADDVAATLGDHPGLGSEKAAEHLAGHTGLDVQRADIQELSAQGILQPVGEYKGWPMYGIEDLEALPTDQVTAIIAQRHDWIAASLTPQEAAEHLGWSVARFDTTAERHGLTPGRFGRYARTDIQALT